MLKSLLAWFGFKSKETSNEPESPSSAASQRNVDDDSRASSSEGLALPTESSSACTPHIIVDDAVASSSVGLPPKSSSASTPHIRVVDSSASSSVGLPPKSSSASAPQSIVDDSSASVTISYNEDKFRCPKVMKSAAVDKMFIPPLPGLMMPGHIDDRLSRIMQKFDSLELDSQREKPKNQ